MWLKQRLERKVIPTLLVLLSLTLFPGKGDTANTSLDRLAEAITAEAGISTTQFENCSKRNVAQIRQAEAHGLKQVIEWKQVLERRYGGVSPFDRDVCNPATRQETLDYKARQVLACVQREMLRGLTYVCNADLSVHHDIAETFPLIGRKVKLDRRLLAGTVPGDLPGTMIHEASHKCGTNDLAYFSATDRPHSVQFSEWPSIADTYYYWAKYGFCIPDVNC
jgi:hypothetical protein